MNYTPGPLPKPCAEIHQFGRPEVQRVFTADELRVHTAAEVERAVAAERELCAKICDKAARSMSDRGRTLESEALHDAAEAIRAAGVDAAMKGKP